MGSASELADDNGTSAFATVGGGDSCGDGCAGGLVNVGSPRTNYYVTSEKMVAASRAAAAVLQGRGPRARRRLSNVSAGSHSSCGYRTWRRRSAGSVSSPKTIGSPTPPSTATSATATTAAVATTSTVQEIAHGSGRPSNGSVAHVSSPSGHSSRENSYCLTSNDVSDSPQSPQSFVFDDSLLDPKTNLLRSYGLSRSCSSFVVPTGVSYTNASLPLMNASPSPVHASPNSMAMNLDWDGYDEFFGDMSVGTAPSTAAGGDGNDSTAVAATTFGVSGGNTDSCGRKNKSASGTTENVKLLCKNDCFTQFNAATGLIPSFDAFGSRSNSSSDLPENRSLVKGLSPVMALTPSSHLPSPCRKQCSPPQLPSPSSPVSLHQRPLMSNAISTPPSPDKRNINVSNELSHSIQGNLEHYDPTLYKQLNSTHPFPATSNAGLPPLVVPRDRAGNGISIIRGSERRHSHVEVKNVGSAVAAGDMAKMYAFYKFLREIYPALQGCQYLLPGLQQWHQGDKGELSLKGSYSDVMASNGCTMNVSKIGSFKLGHVPGMTIAEKSKLTKPVLAVAKRRIECAVYAFGGFVIRRPPKQPQSDKRSIFRTRNESPSPLSTSTNLSSKLSSQRSGNIDKKMNKLARSSSMVRREKYEKKLASQYFEHGNRLSWDVQANLCLTLNGARTFDDDHGEEITGPLKLSGVQQKRKNRCKKCGQIKEGHTCPYQSSLLRSIGVMVYPSANAHVAEEQGKLAPALCEMNNFVIRNTASFGSMISTNETDKRERTVSDTTDANKTSKKTKSSAFKAVSEVNSFRRTSVLAAPTVLCGVIDDKRSDEEEGREDKVDNQNLPPSLLFQPKMEITVDQYRTLTPRRSSSVSSKREYTYPQVPLTYSQRKSMSDALFSLSRHVPKLTEECALVLTEARKRDQWDLAVAELMTQVVCVLYCGPSKDYLLGGLRQYLMGLGIVS